ncbi:MAG: hypothetical protein K1X29_04030 [Bdellovibrionales bacterium]|nr:hypothetical protein [Bdellovibrionales bacterium]
MILLLFCRLLIFICGIQITLSSSFASSNTNPFYFWETLGRYLRNTNDSALANQVIHWFDNNETPLTALNSMWFGEPMALLKERIEDPSRNSATSARVITLLFAKLTNDADPNTIQFLSNENSFIYYKQMAIKQYFYFTFFSGFPFDDGFYHEELFSSDPELKSVFRNQNLVEVFFKRMSHNLGQALLNTQSSLFTIPSSHSFSEILSKKFERQLNHLVSGRLTNENLKEIAILLKKCLAFGFNSPEYILLYLKLMIQLDEAQKNPTLTAELRGSIQRIIIIFDQINKTCLQLILSSNNLKELPLTELAKAQIKQLFINQPFHLSRQSDLGKVKALTHLLNQFRVDYVFTREIMETIVDSVFSLTHQQNEFSRMQFVSQIAEAATMLGEFPSLVAFLDEVVFQATKSTESSSSEAIKKALKRRETLVNTPSNHSPALPINQDGVLADAAALFLRDWIDRRRETIATDKSEQLLKSIVVGLAMRDISDGTGNRPLRVGGTHARDTNDAISIENLIMQLEDATFHQTIDGFTFLPEATSLIDIILKFKNYSFDDQTKTILKEKLLKKPFLLTLFLNYNPDVIFRMGLLFDFKKVNSITSLKSHFKKYPGDTLSLLYVLMHPLQYIPNEEIKNQKKLFSALKPAFTFFLDKYDTQNPVTGYYLRTILQYLKWEGFDPVSEKKWRDFLKNQSETTFTSTHPVLRCLRLLPSSSLEK